MAAWKDFLPDLMPYVQDCPDLLGAAAVRNAAIEFCRRTQVWTYDPALITLTPGTATYTPVLPADTQLAAVLQAYVGEFFLPPKSTDELARIFRFSNWTTMEGYPRYITMPDPTTVRVVPMLDPSSNAPDPLKLRVALMPTKTAATCADFLYGRYSEDLVYGALARIYGAATQPFSNPNMALLFQRRFNHSIYKASSDAQHAFGRNAGKVEFQRIL